MEWQDISTAPRDGTPMQGWVHEINRGVSAVETRTYWEPKIRFEAGEWEYKHSHGWFFMNMVSWIERHPTHWMPLPTPPETGHE